MPAISHRNRLLEEIQANPAIALAYNPAAGAVTAPNLGSLAGVPDLSLQGGATLQTPGLIQGGASAVLDGKTGYADTGVLTRTNTFTNPSGESGKTNGWSNAGSGATISIVPASAEPADGGTKAIRAEMTEAAKSGFIYLGAPCTPGVSYVLCAEINSCTKPVMLQIVWKNGASEVIGITSSIASSAPGMRYLIAVAPPGATLATRGVAFAHGGETTIGDNHVFDCAMFGPGTTEIPFFPTAEQLASGQAGWAGAPNESESDLGPLARGASRVFMGAADALQPAGASSLFGGAIGTNHNGLKLEFNGNVVFGNSAAEGPFGSVWMWTFGVRNIWALAYDDSTRKATLYLNGVAIGTTTMAKARSPIPQQSLLIGARQSAALTPQQQLAGSILPFLMAQAPAGEQALSDEEIARLSLVMEQGGISPPVMQGPYTVDIDPYEAAVDIDPYEAAVDIG